MTLLVNIGDGNTSGEEPNLIDVVVTRNFDYSTDSQFKLVPQFPWSDPQKLSSPLDTAIPGAALGVAWSPCGEYLAASHASSPLLTIYKRAGTRFVKIANPGTLPTGTGSGIYWSNSGSHLICSHSTTPFLTVYSRSGDTFTKLTNPASLPPTTLQDCTISPNGRFLAVAHATSPYMTIYDLVGSTLTKQADAADLHTTTGRNCAYSPCGRWFASCSSSSTVSIKLYEIADNVLTIADSENVGGSTNAIVFSPDSKWIVAVSETTPFIKVYEISSNGTLTVQSNPTDLPAGLCYGVEFSPNGKILFVGHDTTPYLTAYSFEDGIVEKLANFDVAPTGRVSDVAISPDCQFLALALNVSPYLEIYQTSSDIPTSGVARVYGFRRDGQ